MLPIQTVLLFGDTPRFDVQTACDNLISHLQSTGHLAEEVSPTGDELMRFHAGSLGISIAMKTGPLDTESFATATDSPLCRQAKSTLVDCIGNHHHHLVISLDQLPATPTTNPLHQLRLAHQAATFFVALTGPLAVHWRQSNILLTGSQYLQLAGQATPWTLFARLREIGMTEAREDSQSHGIIIENAEVFVGAPVRLEPSSISLDTACAAALAFLRHAVQSDVPLGDGQTFGPGPEMLFRLNIIKPCTEYPTGLYQLWEAKSQPQTAPGTAARVPGATLNAAITSLETPGRRADGLPSLYPPETDTRTDKIRSLALSFLMLALVPALGATLLVSNVIFGTNAVRTGLAALAVVAVGLIIGAVTFLNVDVQKNANLAQPDLVISSPMQP